MSENKILRILLADVHPLFRRGVKSFIQKNLPSTVIYEIEKIEKFSSFIEMNPVEMIIVGDTFLDISGYKTIGLIKKTIPSIKFLIFCNSRDKKDFYNAMDAGADGYLGKFESDKELLNGIECVRRGNKFISSFWMEKLMGDGVNPDVQSCLEDEVKLTARENDIFELLLQGSTSKQIATHFNRSPRTIEHHRHNILRKFKKKNTTDLVFWAVSNGLG